MASLGYRVPFFDYDIFMLPEIVMDLEFIQFQYNLSTIYIFCSNNGYNALSLDKIPYNILFDIYKDTKFVCKDYITFGSKRNFLTLRIGKDKKLCTILHSNNIKYEKSLSHALALNLFYDMKIDIVNNNFDINNVLRIKAYRSEKDGFMEVKNW